MVYTETRPRGPIFIDFAGPGPAYSLPNLIGTDNHDTRSNFARGPSYSMGGKWKERRTGKGVPGPIYNPRSIIFREGAGPSLKSRHSEPSQANTGPGPGAYHPNTSGLSEVKHAPAYSIAKRHRSRRSQDETPGPNAYVPSFANREGKGFSLKGRYKERTNNDNTPGPMSYKPGSGMNRYGKMTGPEASIKGRNYAESRGYVGPGPGAYRPQTDSLSSNKTLPAWSLSSRHKELGDKDKSPGPQTYKPPAPSETASAPAYSLQGKYKSRNKADDSPGPAKYNPDPSVGSRGRAESKAASMKGRYKDSSKYKSPGPGAYENVSPRDNGPAYSISGKWSKKKDDDLTPGPNKYFPTVSEEGPAYSLKGRHKDSDGKEKAPGPGTYDVRNKLDPGPAYSMGGKWMADESKKKGEHSPGPASYNPPKHWVKDDGGVSFGVRHSRAKYETATAKKPKQQ